MISKENELKPCPFCGVKMELWTQNNMHDIIKHPFTDCILHGFKIYTDNGDYSEWNTIPSEDKLKQELEEARKLLKECDEIFVELEDYAHGKHSNGIGLIRSKISKHERGGEGGSKMPRL